MLQVKLITQSLTKRIVARALRDFRDDQSLTNSEIAEVLGNCEGTVRNRLDDSDPKKQLDIHEFRRLIGAGQLKYASAMLADLGVQITAIGDSE